MNFELLRPKMENIINAHVKNEDDKVWLFALFDQQQREIEIQKSEVSNQYAVTLEWIEEARKQRSRADKNDNILHEIRSLSNKGLDGSPIYEG